MQTLISHTSGDCKSKMKVLAGVGPSEASAWHVDIRLLPVSSRALPPVCVCALVSSYKSISQGRLGG